jgi:hypothetical protein
MIEISLGSGVLILDVQGWSKLWTLKSRLEIPLENIRGVRIDPEIARGWWKGIRAPGTHIPGLIVAGTFYHDGKRVFWDVRDAERTIVIELLDESYDQLIVEVADPLAAVSKIESAVPRREPTGCS